MLAVANKLYRVVIEDISDGQPPIRTLLEHDEAKAVLDVVKALKGQRAEARQQAEERFLQKTVEVVEKLSERLNNALQDPLVASLVMQGYQVLGRPVFVIATDDRYGVGQTHDGGTFPPVPRA